MNAHLINLDAGETIFFLKELEHRKAKSYDVMKAPLKAFELFPVSTEAGEGAETITYEQYESLGIAKIIADYADDLPRCDIKGQEFTARVRGVGSSFGYSKQEIRAAKMAGKPLQQRKANAALEAQRRVWNQVAFRGDAGYGLQGLFTNTNIPTVTLPSDGTGSSALLLQKTPDQIVRDLNAIANSVITVTRGVEQPDTMVLPINVYAHIASTRMATGTDTTILGFFLANNSFITTVTWADEMAVGLNGNPTALVYKKSPDKLTLEMPMMYTQGSPQEQGLNYVVPCESRIGGLIIYYPLSLAMANV